MTEAAHPALEPALAAGVRALGQALEPADISRLATLLAELARWNRRINLTAVREPGRMVGQHVLDSLAVRPLLRGARVLDVGTGAGFPGLPLAIASPAMQFTLLDSNGKKISFVRHMIGELGLSNAEAVQARVERHAPAEAYDTVVARAFAPLPRMLELAGHLVADGGVLLALKGHYPETELAELGDDWTADVSRLTVPGLDDHERHAVRLSRRGGAAA